MFMLFMRRKLSSHYLSRMITRARVDGMSCQHCVRAVFMALTALEGITRADVSIGAIEIEHDGRVTVDQLRDAIAVAGYTVRDGETNRRALPLI
jgi:copper chaperone